MAMEGRCHLPWLNHVPRCPQMSGHGEKLGRKMEQAVIAILASRNDEEAAQSIGVSAKTLQRWRKLPEFDQALRDARLAAFRQSGAPAASFGPRSNNALEAHGGWRLTGDGEGAVRVLHPGSDAERRRDGKHRKTSYRAGASCGAFGAAVSPVMGGTT